MIFDGGNFCADEKPGSEGMQVSIQPGSGECFEVNLPSVYTVLAAKRGISQTTGHAVHMQQLFSGDCETQLLDEMEISEQMLYLMLASRSYTEIKEFDTVVQLASGAYPGGVSFMDNGHVVWVGFYGDAEVVDPGNATTQACTVAELTEWKQILRGQCKQLYLSEDGDVLVAATLLGSVVIFDKELKYKGALGASAGLNGPRGVVCSKNIVYVADTGNNRLVLLDRDAQNESDQLVKTVGQSGMDPGEFREPTSLEIVHTRDLLVVADRRNNRLQILTLGGEFVRCIGGGYILQEVRLPEHLHHPNDMCVDEDENLVVYDTKNQRLAVFTLEGKFICSVMPGFFRDTGNTYSNISCCKLTGRIAVSDNDNHRLALLRPELW
jgi:sugar lactone lactonase YvrE